ncbi:MAG: 4Fe-4S binding protein [Methanopyraceae archaeon]
MLPDYLSNILTREGGKRLLDAHSPRKIRDRPRRFRDFPTIDLDRCVNCGACADACPVGESDDQPPALEITDRGPVVHRERCIRCGLCAEVCPVGAIEVGALTREVEERITPPKPARVVVDEDLCVGCGRCRDVCPSDAIEVDDTARVDPDRCVLCERCIEACPVAGAIKIIPMDVEELSERWAERLKEALREAKG